MDVIRELPWARWGPMVAREVQTERGRVRVLGPRRGRAQRRAYDPFETERSLLDDLVEAADSEAHRAMWAQSFGAGSAARGIWKRAAKIHERDLLAAASRWGFLGEPYRLTEDEPKPPFYESLAFWSAELRDLRAAWELHHMGGNLSGFMLRLHAQAVVDAPTGVQEWRLDEHGHDWLYGPGAQTVEQRLRQTPKRKAESARSLLEQALGLRLSRADVEIVVGRSRYRLRPRSLIAVAWLQLGERVVRALPEKTCPQCGKAFQPPTVRRIYCGEPCKDAAKNARRPRKTTRRKS